VKSGATLPMWSAISVTCLFDFVSVDHCRKTQRRRPISVNMIKETY
jgi:hypothetical protein